MEHRFFLKPNYHALHKHGYKFTDEQAFEEEVYKMKTDGYVFESPHDYQVVRNRLLQQTLDLVDSPGIYFNSENFQTEIKRLQVEEGFKRIVNNYGLEEHYDTLLFVALAEFDHAWLNLDHIWVNQSSKVRAKELAQLLLLYHNTPKGKAIEIVFKPQYGDTVKVKDERLSDWIGDLIKDAFENGRFPLGHFGNEVTLMFTGTSNPINLERNNINITRLEATAGASVKSFKVSHRKYFTQFAFNLWCFLNDTTSLKAAPERKFSDEQLRFLYEVSALFKWFNPDGISSPPADYMSTLFSNHTKR